MDAELLLRESHAHHGLHVVVIRPALQIHVFVIGDWQLLLVVHFDLGPEFLGKRFQDFRAFFHPREDYREPLGLATAFFLCDALYGRKTVRIIHIYLVRVEISVLDIKRIYSSFELWWVPYNIVYA